MTSSSADHMVWFQISGHVDHVFVKSGIVVSQLRDEIKRKVQPLLDDVPTLFITLFANESDKDDPNKALPFQNIKQHTQNPTKTMCVKVFMKTVVVTCFFEQF